MSRTKISDEDSPSCLHPSDSHERPIAHVEILAMKALARPRAGRPEQARVITGRRTNDVCRTYGA
jgi:hypothetical protein